LLENPNESMQCKFERAMPTPSSCTESAIFPGSNSNASTSTRVAPHSWSCALCVLSRREERRRKRGQTRNSPATARVARKKPSSRRESK
jgi:hypothetical protein